MLKLTSEESQNGWQSVASARLGNPRSWAAPNCFSVKRVAFQKPRSEVRNCLMSIMPSWQSTQFAATSLKPKCHHLKWLPQIGPLFFRSYGTSFRIAAQVPLPGRPHLLIEDLVWSCAMPSRRKYTNFHKWYNKTPVNKVRQRWPWILRCFFYLCLFPL